MILIRIGGSLLFLAAIHCAYPQSLDCSIGGARETGPKTGPDGAVAVLKVVTHDDNMKNSHDCMAEYHLHVTLPDGREEAPNRGYGFTNSTAEWGRRLSVHLDGFSHDGQHIFGVISESGKYSSIQVFDFRRGGPHVEVEVRQGSAHLKAANCGTSFAVAGTTSTGEIVLEPSTADECRVRHRWVLNQAGDLRDMTQSESLTPLYTSQGH